MIYSLEKLLQTNIYLRKNNVLIDSMQNEKKEFKPVSFFEIFVTPKCNFDCDFCFQAGRNFGNKNMTLEDFKALTDKIADFSKEGGKDFPICIGGGEPFLHPQIVEMTAYAVQKLGRKNVSITTNGSMLPLSKHETVELLKKMDLPRLNLSIDREHLKFGKRMPERLKAAFEAIEETGCNASVINIARNAYERKHRWAREVFSVLPKGVRYKSQRESSRIKVDERTDGFRRKEVKEIDNFLKALTEGKRTTIPITVAVNLNISPSYIGNIPGLKATIDFAPDGKAYISTGEFEPLHVQQFSLGSWKRETLEDIVSKNLPYKTNMLLHWLGDLRLKPEGSKETHLGKYEAPSKRKAQLYARAALKRSEMLRQRRARK